MVILLVASSVSISSVLTIQTNVRESIQEHARGSYDILIRPAEAATSVEKTLGKVEENYLNYGAGGISLEEWEKIKALSEVDIAAPVISLGYFTGENKSLALDYPSKSSYISGYFETYDGVNHYEVEDTFGVYYMLEQEGYPENGFDFLKRLGVGFTGEGMSPEFDIPITYDLTVGVDVEEEQRLTGIDLSALNNEIPHQMAMAFESLNVEREIRLIYLEDSFSPLKLQVNVKDLNWGTQDTINLKESLNLSENEPLFLSERFEGLMEELEMDYLSDDKYTFDMSKYITPFLYNPLIVDYDHTVKTSDNFSSSLGESSHFYKINPIDYMINSDGTLTVKQVGEHLGVPTYRDMNFQGVSVATVAGTDKTIPFILFPVGSFTTVEYQNTLSSSPLGIYQQAPTITLDEEQPLHETLTPGSFISSPAKGIMSLEDAAYIKGDSPIDAIRVRVSDIKEYDDEAIAKIEEALIKISQIGNFQMDVVAGASISKMAIDVEGIGMVSQPWTSLGAAAEIADGWNGTNILVTGLFFLIGLLYPLNNAFFRNRTSIEDKKIISDLGWKPSHIRKLYFMESAIILVLAALGTSLALIILYTYGYVHIMSFPYVLLSIIIALVVTWLINRFQNSSSTNKTESPKFKTLWLRSLYYFRHLIVFSFLQIVLLTVIITFIPVNLYQTILATGDTNLGEYINATVLVFVIIIFLAALILTTATLSETISSTLHIRKDEVITLKDIGWKIKDVRGILVKETMVWMMIAVICGFVISLTMTLMFYPNMSANVVFIKIICSLSFSILCFIMIYILMTRRLKSYGTT